MSPILVRPVREQLEHDRVIRLLQAKWKRRYSVEMNPGDERNAAIRARGMVLYPDLILTAANGGKKTQTVVEVETGESLNHLEVMAQWVHFAKLRIPFQLYVPANGVDVARRLCAAHNVQPSEIWSYLTLGDGVRFLQIFKAKEAATSRRRAVRTAAARPAAGTRRRSTGGRKAASAGRAEKAGPAERARPAARGARSSARSKPSAKTVKRTASPAKALSRAKASVAVGGRAASKSTRAASTRRTARAPRALRRK